MTLQFTLYNPRKYAVVGGIDIYDEISLNSPELEYGDYAKKDHSLLISPGISHIIILIDPLTTNQGKFFKANHKSSTAPEKQQTDFYIQSTVKWR